MFIEIWTVKAILRSDRNEEHDIGQWRRGDPCYKVAKNLAELCSGSSVLRKVQLMSNKI